MWQIIQFLTNKEIAMRSSPVNFPLNTQYAAKSGLDVASHGSFKRLVNDFIFCIEQILQDVHATFTEEPWYFLIFSIWYLFTFNFNMVSPFQLTSLIDH